MRSTISVKLLFILIFSTIITSCDLFEWEKKKAIEICQSSKIQLDTDNPIGNLILYYTLLKTDASWLDFANTIAQEEHNKTYKWQAEESEIPGLYVVSFTDESNWGYRWEVSVKEQIVKYINANEYLSLKYGLSRVSDNEDFTLYEITMDTLVVQGTRNPEIHYEIAGKIVNNTKNVIIDANLDGELKLVFEEKTISAENRASYGFDYKVSKSNPWKPGVAKKFKLKTEGIESIYSEYIPPYVLFEISLVAEDPIGYSFDENIVELDLKEDWTEIKESK